MPTWCTAGARRRRTRACGSRAPTSTRRARVRRTCRTGRRARSTSRTRRFTTCAPRPHMVHRHAMMHLALGALLTRCAMCGTGALPPVRHARALPPRLRAARDPRHAPEHLAGRRHAQPLVPLPLPRRAAACPHTVHYHAVHPALGALLIPCAMCGAGAAPVGGQHVRDDRLVAARQHLEHHAAAPHQVVAGEPHVHILWARVRGWVPTPHGVPWRQMTTVLALHLAS